MAEEDDVIHDFNLWMESREESASKGGRLDPDADCFKPPPGSILVECVHCGEEYESYLIEWRVFDRSGRKMGFWCCPTEGCGGAGFGFDIFPIDPEDCERFGIHFCDDDESDEEEYDEDEADFNGEADIINPFPKPYPSSSDLPPISDDDIPY